MRLTPPNNSAVYGDRLIHVRLLGQTEIHVGDQILTPKHERLFAALLVLVLSRGRTISRDRMCELLWPGAPLDNARHSLRQNLYRLRKMGAPIGGSDVALLLPRASFVLDTDFDPSAIFQRGGIDVVRRLEAELLADCDDLEPASVRRWIDDQRLDMQGELRRDLTAALAQCRQRNRWDLLAASARALRLHDPLSEPAAVALAEAHAMYGEKREALAVLESFAEESGNAGLGAPPTIAALRKRIGERNSAPSAITDIPIVGRTAELQTIGDVLGEARSGRGTNLVILGEPGIGKSRLVVAAARMAELSSMTFVQVNCRRSTADQLLRLIRDLAERLNELPGSLGVSPESLKVILRLSGRSSEIDGHETSQLAELPAQDIVRALVELMSEVASERPIVVAVEDSHWMDEFTADLLCTVGENIVDARCALLFTSRIPDPLGLRASSIFPLRTMRLLPLDEHDTRELALAFARTYFLAITEENVSHCCALAGGNALFASQVVAHWAVEGRVGDVPRTLEALLRERIDQLAPSSLRLLQCIALLGPHTSFDRLESMLGLARHSLIESLEDLELRGLLASANTSVRARHDLIAETSLQRLPSATLRLLHRCAALSLASEARETQRAAVVIDCAVHFLSASDAESAERLFGAVASELCATGRAYYASELLLSARQVAALSRIDGVIANLLGEAAVRSGRFATAAAALRLSQAGGPIDGDLTSITFEALRPSHSTEGNARRALQQASNQSLPIVERLALIGSAIALSGNAASYATVDEAFTFARQLPISTMDERRAFLRVNLAREMLTGSLEESLVISETLIALSQEPTPPDLRWRAFGYAGRAARRLGIFDKAHAHMTEAYKIAQRHSLHTYAVCALIERAFIAFQVGDLELATALCDGATQEIPSNEDSDNELTLISLRARLALLGKRRDEEALASVPSLASVAELGEIVYRTQFFALRFYKNLQNSRPVDAQSLALAKSDILRLVQIGDQDFPAASVVDVDASEGRLVEARSFAADYLAARRERSQLDPVLAKALSRIDSNILAHRDEALAGP